VGIPLDQIVIQTVNGIVNGMILALVASGLTLIFGIMDVVNFAHGDLVMLGGFTGASTLALTGNFWLALVAAAITIAVLGAALQASTLRPLLGRDPLTTILATFGLSLVLQKVAIWQWGPSARQIQEPITGQFTLFYLQYPWYRVATAVLAAGIIGALYAFLKYGRYGIWIRATTADFTLRAFIVVVVGGMGNLGGSILASIFISLLEAYASLVVSPAQAVIVSFVALIVTLLFRPTGLFVPTPK
jgi:branched-subunit amino acid ABC-type transport system permease component